MLNFKGLVYVKHGRVGSRSEGPDYYLQTVDGDYLLQYQSRLLWQPDYQLEFYCRRMVEVTGVLQGPRVIDVRSIAEILAPTLPVSRPPNSLELGESASVTVGSLVQYPGMTLTVLSVLEDSRCPFGRVCIWEGNARVSLQIEPEGGSPLQFELTLHGGQPELAETTLAGFRIKLLQLEPVRQPAADELSPKYTVTVVVNAAPPKPNEERLDVDGDA